MQAKEQDFISFALLAVILFSNRKDAKLSQRAQGKNAPFLPVYGIEVPKGNATGSVHSLTATAAARSVGIVKRSAAQLPDVSIGAVHLLGECVHLSSP